MIALKKIEEIAGKVVLRTLTRAHFQKLTGDTTLDGDGNEALQITVVLKPGAADVIEGEMLLETLVQIQADLRKAGEERFAFVDYATEDELKNIGDS